MLQRVLMDYFMNIFNSSYSSLKFSFGMMYEHQTIKITNSDVGQRFVYFSSVILVHHLVLFSLEVFNQAK